jgi:hypothetical protein
MPKMVDEISAAYENAKKEKARPAQTPGYPGKTLSKNEGDPVMLDEYKSIVGKILYCTTKMASDIGNAARELATHLSNPNEEHWKALERCV